MEHVLDNPVYNALISGNKNLAYGTENIKYFAKDVAPFVGLQAVNQSNFEQLSNIIPFKNTFVYVSPASIAVPHPWEEIVNIPGFQMVFNALLATLPFDAEIIPLNETHVPEMLALTQLTNPGPFAANTIAFGNYKGIFVDNKLVAMAGYRLHVFDFVEISAVCTHPNHLGKGYAKKLMQHLINDIQASAQTPFLHVKADNERAINVYKTLGFDIRTAVSFYVIKRKADDNL